jgi:hypothetical protein
MVVSHLVQINLLMFCYVYTLLDDGAIAWAIIITMP